MPPSEAPTALDYIADDHAAVRKGMERIRVELESLRPPSDAEGWGQLPLHLHSFRGFLAHHFRNEEQAEFLGSRSWDPVSRGHVDRLIVQHHEFLAQIDRHVAELQATGPGPERLRELSGELENLFANIGWHDSVETGLMRKLQHGG